MATPFRKVYEAFLARITADEWSVEEEISIVERDWQQLLDMAIFTTNLNAKNHLLK